MLLPNRCVPDAGVAGVAPVPRRVIWASSVKRTRALARVWKEPTMIGFWQKFVAGLRLTLLVALAIHVVLFVILNISAVVDTRLSLIYKSYDRPNFLLVMLLTSVISI